MAVKVTKYKVRTLVADDIFSVMSLIARLDIKDDLKQVLHDGKAKFAGQEEVGQEEVQTAGMELLTDIGLRLVENLPKVKNELNAFLASLTDLTGEEVGQLPLPDYFTLIKDVVMQPELIDFLESTLTSATSKRTAPLANSVMA